MKNQTSNSNVTQSAKSSEPQNSIKYLLCTLGLLCFDLGLDLFPSWILPL